MYECQESYRRIHVHALCKRGCREYSFVFIHLTLIDENTCNMFFKKVFYELMCNS